jgi:hypothetical protein
MIAKRVVLVGCVALHACAGRRPTSPQVQLRPQIISELEAVTNLDEVGPGGFDQAVSARFYAARLFDCGNRVLKVTEGWAIANSLRILKAEAEPRRVLVHVAADTDGQGFYEVIYRLADDGQRARVSFDYYDKRGSASDPVLKNEEESNFAAQLRDAIMCTQ